MESDKLPSAAGKPDSSEDRGDQAGRCEDLGERTIDRMKSSADRRLHK